MPNSPLQDATRHVYWQAEGEERTLHLDGLPRLNAPRVGQNRVRVRGGGLDFEGNQLGVGVKQRQGLRDKTRERAWTKVSMYCTRESGEGAASTQTRQAADQAGKHGCGWLCALGPPRQEQSVGGGWRAGEAELTLKAERAGRAERDGHVRAQERRSRGRRAVRDERRRSAQEDETGDGGVQLGGGGGGGGVGGGGVGGGGQTELSRGGR